MTGPAYRLDPRSTRQHLAVTRRYADDHPDYDPTRHMITVRVVDGPWEITGHTDRDPDIERRMAMCCCHPDLPRGHR